MGPHRTDKRPDKQPDKQPERQPRHPAAMDALRFGHQVRALRRRRGWRQEDLAAASGVSQAAVSRLELGQIRGLSLRSLTAVTDALGATLDLRLRWNGEALDRLLDEGHAAAVEQTARLLIGWHWEVSTEVTFAIYGERGSVDILARHQLTGVLLVVEVKTVVPDLQSMLAAHDRKARLAPAIARERSWPAGPVARLLVIVASRTARRRVAEHHATFATTYAKSSPAMRAWLRHPGRDPVAGLLFVPNTRHAVARHRIRRSRRGAERGAGAVDAI
jgi:transcriptional regulator with XRE-family HTH domain